MRGVALIGERKCAERACSTLGWGHVSSRLQTRSVCYAARPARCGADHTISDGIVEKDEKTTDNTRKKKRLEGEEEAAIFPSAGCRPESAALTTLALMPTVAAVLLDSSAGDDIKRLESLDFRKYLKISLRFTDILVFLARATSPPRRLSASQNYPKQVKGTHVYIYWSIFSLSVYLSTHLDELCVLALLAL